MRSSLIALIAILILGTAGASVHADDSPPSSQGRLPRVVFSRPFCQNYEAPRYILARKTKIGGYLGIDKEVWMLTSDGRNIEDFSRTGGLYDSMALFPRGAAEFNLNMAQYWLFMQLQPGLKKRYRQEFQAYVVSPVLEELRRMGIVTLAGIESMIQRKCELKFKIRLADGQIVVLQRAPYTWIVHTESAAYRTQLPGGDITTREGLDDIRERRIFDETSVMTHVGDEKCEGSLLEAPEKKT